MHPTDWCGAHKLDEKKLAAHLKLEKTGCGSCAQKIG